MAYHNGHLVWYAVCIGKDDNDHGYGSYNKREAVKMANEFKRDTMRAGQQIRIDVVDPDDDFCLREIIIREEADEED